MRIKKLKKPTRSLSGVLPLTVVSMPIDGTGCKHKCIYCPTLGVPKSYTPESPAILRAKALGYNAFKQVKARLKILRQMGHRSNKIELIFIGGTFLEMPLIYQYNFVKSCYDALNGRKAKNLNQAKKINEKTKNRVVAFCIETRPDVTSENEIERLLDFGCTRVELGVQAIDDKILNFVKRGHGVKEIKKATQLLKDSCFKVGYHFMPGLPGSSIKKDIAMYKKLWQIDAFKPDHIKIYPTQVIKGSLLEKLYLKNKYIPYPKSELTELLIKLKELTPRYCRIMRVMREIPKQWLVAGTININLRQELKVIMKKKGKKCKCIRCREPGFKGKEKVKLKDIEIKITSYKASKGKEFFIEAIDATDTCYGLIRLRFPYKPFIDELKDKALIRELHVYGTALVVKDKNSSSIQHKGIGKMLLETAESLANSKYDAVAVISGPGVREYYRTLNYKLGKWFMLKNLC